MQKLQLAQKLVNKLSAQQIQFVNLLQVPTHALNHCIAQEVANNPLLDDENLIESIPDPTEAQMDENPSSGDVDLQTYHTHLKQYRRNVQDLQDLQDRWCAIHPSWQESLKEQFQLLGLGELHEMVGLQIIGSLDQDGYLAPSLEVIVQDLRLAHGIELSLDEATKVLNLIQSLGPPGIAARNLQECLSIQLKTQPHSEVASLAHEIIQHHFDLFMKKHYAKIMKNLMVPDAHLLKQALDHIANLHPKPILGQWHEVPSSTYFTPDFVILEQGGQFLVRLAYEPTIKPRLNRHYQRMLALYEKKNNPNAKDKEMVLFLKNKLEAAQWFMQALAQREQTLLKTMQAIFDWQYRFFLEDEDIEQLVPMVLQNIADKIDMDVSTVSRIVRQKSIQGRFKVYPLKFFFSEGVQSTHQAAVSSKAVKQRILHFIDGENKQHPYTDQAIVSMLHGEGIRLARRTVAKYREQLNMPIARMRKVFL